MLSRSPASAHPALLQLSMTVSESLSSSNIKPRAGAYLSSAVACELRVLTDAWTDLRSGGLMQSRRWSAISGSLVLLIPLRTHPHHHHHHHHCHQCCLLVTSLPASLHASQTSPKLISTRRHAHNTDRLPDSHGSVVEDVKLYPCLSSASSSYLSFCPRQPLN